MVRKVRKQEMVFFDLVTHSDIKEQLSGSVILLGDLLHREGGALRPSKKSEELSYFRRRWHSFTYRRREQEETGRLSRLSAATNWERNVKCGIFPVHGLSRSGTNVHGRKGDFKPREELEERCEHLHSGMSLPIVRK
jgi:hypothetical protein